MAFVVANSAQRADGTATQDVTLDTGTSSNRKAMIFTVAQDGEIQTMSVARDPSGSNEAATKIREENVLNSGDAYYHGAAFYLDMGSNTGSQTFRVTYNGTPEKLGIAVVVWDGMSSGAVEANEFVSSTSASDTVTDSITTIAANAVIFQLAWMRTSTNESAPWWTPDNSQTERVDQVIDARLEWTVGDLEKAIAGAQTIGSTGAASAQIQAQILVSVAPSGGGGSAGVRSLAGPGGLAGASGLAGLGGGLAG